MCDVCMYLDPRHLYPSAALMPDVGFLLGLYFLAAKVIIVLTVVALVIGIVSIFADKDKFTSSGRGLDTNDWEVDHSVWMNQLQKDFENSWSTE